MWSSSQRVQSVFGTFTTVLFALCFAIACTSYLPFRPFNYTPTTTDVSVSVPSLVVKYSRAPRSYSSKQQEYAHTTFDASIDVRGLFHWNTKQVFAYLVASYSGHPYTSNDVTLWDAIITSREDAVVHVKGRKNKYAFGDITKTFGARNVTVALHWNVMPHVGVLQWGHVRGSQVLTFPQRSN